MVGRAEAVLGQVEGAFVLGADGGVEELRVAQAHLGRDVPEQGHQRLERDAGVDQGGGVGVAQLVRGDVTDPGASGGAVAVRARTRVLGRVDGRGG